MWTRPPDVRQPLACTLDQAEAGLLGSPAVEDSRADALDLGANDVVAQAFPYDVSDSLVNHGSGFSSSSERAEYLWRRYFTIGPPVATGEPENPHPTQSDALLM